MPRRLSVILLAGALLGLPAAAQAATSRSATLHEAAARRAGERALHEARDALRYGHVKTGLDVTSLLKELAVHLPALTGRERTEARRLLARPSTGASDYQTGFSAPDHTHCGLHFCIHWLDAGPNAPPLDDANNDGVPDYVEEMDGVFEHVYQVENVQMGWRAPVGDGWVGGGGFNKTDVYIADLGGQGIFGYSTPDPGQTTNSQAGYLVMDNDYSPSQYRYSDPLPPMEVTAAHEYNHVLQFGYDVLEDTWMLESTAVWMEDKVYTDVNDYVSYVWPWTRMTQVPVTRFNSSDPSDDLNIKVYGDVVWNKWLDAHYGQNLIRRAWEDSAAANPPSFAPAAYDAALRERGSSFFDAFVRFAADTAEWGANRGRFPEGNTWPDVARANGATLRPSSGQITGHLDHTAYVLANVAPTHDRRIKLIGSLPSGTAGAVALVARKGPRDSGSVVVRLRERPRGGRAIVTLDNPGAYSRITAVLVNADVSQDGFSQSLGDWHFTKDHRSISGFVSNDFTPPAVRRRSPRPGRHGVSRRAKVVVAFTEAVGDVNSRTAELIGPGGRRVPARLSYDSRRHRLHLIPLQRLARNAHYVVKLGGAIVDDAGNALPAAQRNWAFRT